MTRRSGLVKLSCVSHRAGFFSLLLTMISLACSAPGRLGRLILFIGIRFLSWECSREGQTAHPSDRGLEEVVRRENCKAWYPDSEPGKRTRITRRFYRGCGPSMCTRIRSKVRLGPKGSGTERKMRTFVCGWNTSGHEEVQDAR